MNKKLTSPSHSAALEVIPTREIILKTLRESSQAMSLKALVRSLKITKKALDGFNKRLAAMQRDGQLTTDHQGEFVLAQQADFIVGRVQGHRDGFGFLLRNDGAEDIYLPEREMQKVMHNDIVQVRLTGYDRRGRPEGQVVEVVERANHLIIGRLLNENGVLLVAPEDQRLNHDVLIAPKSQGKAKLGQVVGVQITRFPDRHTQAMGKVVEILGEIDDPGMEIEIAVRKFNVPYQFAKPTLDEAQALPDKATAKDRNNRIDLRDIPLVTIDGADARDFDDAVYCEPITLGRGKKKNAWRLLVAIADVSHYVKPATPLDNDALLRATSVYFPRRVIPMLPEKLSNGLCSLNPHVERLCVVCDMVIDQKGNVKAYQFYSAVMCSAARLTYDEVAQSLTNTHGPEAKKMAQLMPHLQNLYDLYKTLWQARQKRGAIDFDTTESKIICNAQGKIEKILPSQRNEAHKLIEECMLAANVCAADLFARQHHPGLYRVHDTPHIDKLDNLRAFLRVFGLTLAGKDKPQATDYANLIEQIKNRPDTQLIQTMILRSFQQAVYSATNIGHFGLAYPAYTHFTSPIRRYPDLLVHRVIKALLAGTRYHPSLPEKISLNTSSSTRTKKTNSSPPQLAAAAPHSSAAATHTSPSVKAEANIWEQLALHCSANERRADEASRDVEAWLKCYFMRDKLGNDYPGIVTGITPFGLFIQLETLYVEGLVHVTELGNDYFEYDEVHNELRGQRTGMRYRLTDRIHVQVLRVDLDSRKIDFGLLHSPFSARNKKQAKASASKSSSRTASTKTKKKKSK